MVEQIKVNVGFRIHLLRELLDDVQVKVDRCDLSPLTTPSLIENFGAASGNLMLLDVAIHYLKTTQEEKREFEDLRKRYYNLEKEFTNKCDCKLKMKN